MGLDGAGRAGGSAARPAGRRGGEPRDRLRRGALRGRVRCCGPGSRGGRAADGHAARLAGRRPVLGFDGVADVPDAERLTGRGIAGAGRGADAAGAGRVLPAPAGRVPRRDGRRATWSATWCAWRAARRQPAGGGRARGEVLVPFAASHLPGGGCGGAADSGGEPPEGLLEVNEPARGERRRQTAAAQGTGAREVRHRHGVPAAGGRGAVRGRGAPGDRAGAVTVRVHDLRDYTADRHRTVDDAPYGGGPGMVMKVEPFARAVERSRRRRGAPEGGGAALAAGRDVHAGARQAAGRPRACRAAVRALRGVRRAGT